MSDLTDLSSVHSDWLPFKAVPLLNKPSPTIPLSDSGVHVSLQVAQSMGVLQQVNLNILKGEEVNRTMAFGAITCFNRVTNNLGQLTCHLRTCLW